MPDHVKPSRLLTRLNTEIADAGTQIAADCKRAERAAYLARLGRIDDAKSTVAALHQRYEKRPDIEVSIWVHLVEGLICHFSNMDPAARDKIQRAHALSTAADLRPLRALSAAWLAHMEYLGASVEPMTKHIFEALRLAKNQDFSALARVCLVVAQALHIAGRPDLARAWYGRARDNAILDGDDLTTSALMHNMAWLKCHSLRQRVLCKVGPYEDHEHSLLGAESAGDFDARIGSVSLRTLVPILRAQILAARGRPKEALDLYQANLSVALTQGMMRLQADLLADRGWCRLQMGQEIEARRDALAAEASIDPIGQFDDRALAHSRLAQLFAGLGDERSSMRHLDLAGRAWAGHNVFQVRMLVALADVQLPAI